MQSFHDVLSRITANKQIQLEKLKREAPLQSLLDKIENEEVPALRHFEQALRDQKQINGIAIIAELKKASPSKGIFSQTYEPARLATEYQQSGATCLSVLTETDFFLGDDEHLKVAHANSKLPILRKDFIVDDYQIFESRCLGADCVLLIAAALSEQQLIDFYQLAKKLKLDVLVEINNEAELTAALKTNATMIGVNNRNLKDFSVNLARTIALARLIPKDRLAVCESGIRSRTDIELILSNDINIFLIGEALITATSPGKKLEELLKQ